MTLRPVETGTEDARGALSDLRKVQVALLSAYHKDGLAAFAAGLARHGVKILSSGGSAAAIRNAGVAVEEISTYTGWPEMLGGRVKTLHPKVHAGVLARRDSSEQMAELEEAGVLPVDLVAIDPYPFAEIADSSSSQADAVEGIDVGGPTLLRAAAKNYEFVVPVSGREMYGEVLQVLDAHGGSTDLESRRRWAAGAFAAISSYDARIAEFLNRRKANTGENAGDRSSRVRRSRPEGVTSPCIEGPRAMPSPQDPNGEVAERPSSSEFPARPWEGIGPAEALRYGENPHQRAALYRMGETVPGTILGARQVGGKALSFNNVVDLDAALRLVACFDEPAAAVIKHANPCGAALGDPLHDAFRKARRTDEKSAFGGVIALNRSLDLATAETIAEFFVEAVVAPEVSDEARQRLSRKKKLILLEAGPIRREAPSVLELRSVWGGLVAQEWDRGEFSWEEARVVTTGQPTDEEIRALMFAWRVVRFVRSNAIVLAGTDHTVGIGAGQMSRVDSVDLAIRKAAQAGIPTAGSALASDGFFPFADSLEIAARAGVRAVIQPGGSIRDEEVTAAADELGMAMVFTGRRHFRH